MDKMINWDCNRVVIPEQIMVKYERFVMQYYQTTGLHKLLCIFDQSLRGSMLSRVVTVVSVTGFKRYTYDNSRTSRL